MAVASLLTFLAITGVIAGVLLGESQKISCYLAAAGGGLLFGISLFWLVPEIAAASGWLPASALTLGACLALALIDRLFIHSDHGPGREALAPILTATAVHSFLDGWSVRAIGSLQIASITAPLGLALHKIPEGVAIGWIARQSIGSAGQAAAAAIAVELITLVGAFVEPFASRSGSAVFGTWWTSAVVAIVSGSFLFFGVHAILPNRRRAGVVLVFTATLLLVATIGLMKSGNT